MLPKKTLTETKPRTKTAEQALAALMRLCARAEKCEGDARRLLRRWGVADGEAAKVLERLVRERFIDDRRYAAMFVREKLHLSGWGVYKIRTALHRKEIARELIDEALEGLDRDRMGDRLREQLQRKLRTTKAKNGYELRNKLFRYGLSLGYEFEQVREAIDHIQLPTDEDSCDDF